MLFRTFRVGVVPVSILMGVMLISGCAAKRSSTRVPRSGGRVLQNITPGAEYNPPAEPSSKTAPAPEDSDPPPPTRSASDLPNSPPQDDFESAERPGRHSASFGPYTGNVTRASTASDREDSSDSFRTPQ